MIDMPERTWRRWQAKARAGQQSKGPWPQPAGQAARGLATTHALAHPAWGHRRRGHPRRDALYAAAHRVVGCGSHSDCSPPGAVDEVWLQRGLPCS